MQLDRVASEIVIESIKRAIPSRWVAKVEELLSMRRNVPGANALAQYLDYSGLDLEDIL